MKIHRRHFIAMLCLLGSASCSVRKETPWSFQSGQEVKILFIGNSYSFGVPKEFARLAQSRGQKVYIDQVTHSGWSLSQHSNSRATLQKIHERDWDIVVLQERSMIPSLPALQREILMIPPLKKLVAEIQKQQAKPLLYQTWGRRDGDSKLSGDHFLAMNERVRRGCQAASKRCGGLQIVPVGDAWQNALAKNPEQSLFCNDGSHPSKTGNQLSAEVFYQTIFGKRDF